MKKIIAILFIVSIMSCSKAKDDIPCYVCTFMPTGAIVQRPDETICGQDPAVFISNNRDVNGNSTGVSCRLK